MSEEWDRREADRKARAEIAKQFKALRAEVNVGLSNLAERVNELDEYLRGGKGDRDSLGTRVNLMERAVSELQILVKGDVMGRGSLKEMAKDALSQAKDAVAIASGRQETKTLRWGQWWAFAGTVVVAIATIAVAMVANWDTIGPYFGQQRDPVAYAERLERGIKSLKHERGPAVKKKLREIEKAARGARN